MHTGSSEANVVPSAVKVDEADAYGLNGGAVSTRPLRAVRDHLSEVIDRVEFQHERVVVTRNGRDAAVLISPDDLAELEETIDVLRDPDALADIREADLAYARGEVVRGVGAVRRPCGQVGKGDATVA